MSAKNETNPEMKRLDVEDQEGECQLSCKNKFCHYHNLI